MAGEQPAECVGLMENQGQLLWSVPLNGCLAEKAIRQLLQGSQKV